MKKKNCLIESEFNAIHEEPRKAEQFFFCEELDMILGMLRARTNQA